MMVDFAIAAERDEHLSSAEAIRKAALLRFRPIMMTTMAAMLGGVPLMLGHGTGSELRQPLGYAMVGGLHRQPGADAVHDAGDLSLSRPPVALAVGIEGQKAAQRQGARRRAGELARGGAAAGGVEASGSPGTASARNSHRDDALEPLRQRRRRRLAVEPHRDGWMKRWLASNTSARARRRSAMAKAPEARPPRPPAASPIARARGACARSPAPWPADRSAGRTARGRRRACRDRRGGRRAACARACRRRDRRRRPPRAAWLRAAAARPR